MKLFYKSYAPDVSAGSTTIKDVGKKRSPRKLITLWSFLMALLMMVPVGAMAAGDGTETNPWTGDIEQKLINEAGDYYLERVTNGAIKINVSGVILHVAGYNELKSSRNSANNRRAIDVGTNNTTIDNFTIKQWVKEGSSSVAVLNLIADGALAPGNTRPALDFHDDNSCNFIIDGAVAVIANSSNSGTYSARAVYMPEVKVMLQNV